MITSTTNPKIKQARLLRDRKIRQKAGLFLVEGIRLVGEAIAAGARVEAVFFAPELLTSQFAQELIQGQSDLGLPCYATSAEVFVSLAEKENPQGILAVVRQPHQSLLSLSPGTFEWGVALVSPQDPGNVGTILRTIDAVGANGLVLLESSVDPYHPNAVRASMGTLFWYPVVAATFEEFKGWAGKHGYHVYGTSAHAQLEYQVVTTYEKPLILLMGSEREGLAEAQAALCQVIIHLPMRGRATSLNLAVAAGVMLYDMLDKLER